MKNLLLLLFLCRAASPIKHSFRFFLSASIGTSDLPLFTAVLQVDGSEVSYCDSDNRTGTRQDAWRRMLDRNPQIQNFYTSSCSVIQPNFFRERLREIMELFHQTGGEGRSGSRHVSLDQYFYYGSGVHTLQAVTGCDWDQESGLVSGSLSYAYDGEDFIKLDLETLTWVGPTEQAAAIKKKWDADRTRIEEDEKYLTQVWPEWLKTYLNFSSETEAAPPVPPSVSLLRQSPSSPVSCHATGFYPDRAQMFWRKDGEEIHEDVDQGEILPNQDGTFQMRVDLNISADEDWSRYECVFKLSGVDDIITKLNGTMIRTNWVPASESSAGSVVWVVVVLLLLTVGGVGLFIWKKKKSDS